MNRTRLLALAIALALATPSAHAQDSADPKFCESLKSILAATPKGKWPEKPGQTLTWEGGSRACSSGHDGTTLTCPIYDTQMLSTCTLFVRPTAEDMAKDTAAREYARTRLMPAINACFAGAQAETWQVQEANRIVSGMKVTPPGLTPFRFGEGKARIGSGEGMCGFDSVGFEIDALP